MNHEGDKTTVLIVDRNNESRIASAARHPDGHRRRSRLRPEEGEQVVVSDRSGLKAGQEVHPKTVAVMQYHDENAQ